MSKKAKKPKVKEYTPDTKRLKVVFNFYDKEKSGRISEDLIYEALRACDLVILNSEIQEKINKKPEFISGGEITFDNFSKLYKELASEYPIQPGELEKAFKFYDDQKTGMISLERLKTSLGEMGEILTENEINEFIKLVDPNGSGFLDYKKISPLMEDKKI